MKIPLALAKTYKNFIIVKKFKIHNPCSENWGEMIDIPEGKFCNVCSKKVWDFTDKSSEEIEKILLENPKLCGRIYKSKLNIASSILIAVSLTTVSCSNQKVIQNNSIENILDKKILIKGKIDSLKIGFREPQSIKLITKSKLYNGTIDTDNNFQIEVPESIIQEKNILKISYNQIKFGKIIKGSSIHLLSKNDLFSNKTLHADDGMLEIGAVVIVTPTPLDFYYFDGKRISRNKFEKIKKENPNFEYIYLDEEVMTDIITKNAYVGTVYLLYSK